MTDLSKEALDARHTRDLAVARAALEAAATFVSTSHYISCGEERYLEKHPNASGDQHHATIAKSIRALDPAQIVKDMEE